MQFFEQNQPAWDHIYRKVAQYAPQPGSILDIASGPGEPSCYLAAKFPGAAVKSTDISEDFVESARRRVSAKGLSNVTCSWADAQDLAAIDTNSQDVVTVCFGYAPPPPSTHTMSTFNHHKKPPLPRPPALSI